MADARKTKAQLLTELTALRQKVAELEKSQIEQKPFANMGNVREANRNLEITIQSSPLAIIVVDNEDKVRVWNPAAEHMFGWKQQEVMGQSIPTIPDNEKDEFNRIRKPVDQQQVVAIQRTRRRKKDGSVIDVSISVAPVTDTDGHVIGRMGILADITEHVRAEENLRESEEKFRSILEIIDEGYYELDLAGNITFFNKSLPIILGYPEEEMKGLNYCQYMDEKNIKKAFKIYNDVYHTGKLARLRRGEIRRKDGNKIFVELSISLMRDSSGKPIGFRGTVHDITERRRSEEDLYAVKELYQTLAERSFAGIYVVQDGKFRFINSNAASYAGYKREELVDQEAGQLVHPEDSEKVRKNSGAMLRGEITAPYEFRIITKQGETRWIIETITSISYEGTRAILGNSMEITDRKRTEEALRESQKRMSDIIEFLPDAALIIDVDGRVMAWNRAIEKMTGVKAEQMLGKGNYEYSLPFYGTRRPILIDLALKPEPEFERKYAGITRDGDYVYGEAHMPALRGGAVFLWGSAAALRDSEGRVIGAIETIRDITDRKQMEEEIKALSITDPLTGLYNRRGFLTLAEQQLKIAERTKNELMLLFADLDGMKWINDHLGHQRGDEALVEAADVFKEVFRQSDIVARMGGDEFAVLALGSSVENSDILKDRLQQQISIHNHRENRDYALSVSIGMLYSDPKSLSSLDDLMSRADALMYEQKRNKRAKNSVHDL